MLPIFVPQPLSVAGSPF